VIEGIDLHARHAIVTGGASGIGLEIVRALATAGATVTIADIDHQTSKRVAAELQSATLSVTAAPLDLASFASIRAFAANTHEAGYPLHILVNNAGVMAPPLLRTQEGHELQFGLNYLGHFLLTTLLSDRLRAANGARLVSVSSIGHRRSDIDFEDPDFRTRPYERWSAYGQSKTACALLAVAAQHRWSNDGLTAYAVNPGGSMTGLQRFLTPQELKAQGWLDEEGNVPSRWRSAAQCAATSVWAATAPELAQTGGRYLENCNEAGPWTPDAPMQGVKPYALSPENADRLWRLSERLTLAN